MIEGYIEKLLNLCADKSESFADFMFNVHTVCGDIYVAEMLDELFRLGHLDLESFYYVRKKTTAKKNCLGGQHLSCRCKENI